MRCFEHLQQAVVLIFGTLWSRQTAGRAKIAQQRPRAEFPAKFSRALAGPAATLAARGSGVTSCGDFRVAGTIAIATRGPHCASEDLPAAATAAWGYLAEASDGILALR